MKNILTKILILVFILVSSLANASLAKYTVELGSVGCFKRDDFYRVVSFASEGDEEAILQMIVDGKCVYLEKGKILFSSPNVCIAGDKPKDLFLFRPKGMTRDILLPCAVIKAVN
jgi:hypothetical protein